jgi:hypothetical protein
VAGGGGGGGGEYGGAGGSAEAEKLAGGSGSNGIAFPEFGGGGGEGGGEVSAGEGGAGGTEFGCAGDSGSKGGGGIGGEGGGHCPGAGGGGGGGYRGGGGGGSAEFDGGGGGAGSSFIDTAEGSGSVAVNEGEPQEEVVITYTAPKAMCITNSGTITLSPGLTGTAVYQGVKVKGTLTGCTGEAFTEAKYTATLTTSSKVSCSSLSGPGAATFGSVKYVWTPKTKATTGTLGLPLTEAAGVALSSELESGPYSPLTLSGTASESYTNAAICGVPQGKHGVIKAVTKGTFSGSAVGFVVPISATKEEPGSSEGSCPPGPVACA